jgi:phosphatidylinositol alpha-mannosyltransferase
MKIAIISDYFYPSLGGITEHVYNFSKYAIKAGHDVQVITPYPLNHSKSNIDKMDTSLLPGSIIRFGRHLPIFSNGSLSKIGISFGINKKLKNLFKREKFDVIHIHSPLAGFLPMMSIKYSDTLTIGTIHTYFNDNFWFNLFKPSILKYYDALDACISVSDSSRELIEKELSRSPFVIPNGIDVNVFGNTNDKVDKFNDNKVNMFFIGRADVRNGIDVLIKAFLKSIRTYKNMRLIIAGGGPYLSIYKDMVPVENKDDVVFVGKINEERPAYYNTADVHIFPAEIAAHSITVLEGLAAGKPIITTDIKSFSDVITNGKEGFLVKYGDVDTMSQKILELANNKELREKMGKAARARAMDFSWESVTDRIIGFYKDCHKKAVSEKKYPVV